MQELLAQGAVPGKSTITGRLDGRKKHRGTMQQTQVVIFEKSNSQSLDIYRMEL